MKINFILPFKRMTGGIRVAYIYANYLVEQGHDVVCYVPMISYKGKGQSFLYRVKASLGNTIKKDKWFDNKFKIKLIPIVSEKMIRDADVSIATAWQTAYDLASFSPSKGKKYYLVQDYEIFNGEKEEIESSYRLPLNIITVTKGLKSIIKNFTENKINVVYNGLSKNEYIESPKESHKNLVIMMMYHESKHKNSQEGLKIIEQFKKDYPDTEVNIFGRRIPEKLPADYNVLVNPERDLIFKMYRESDIYIFTSEIEAWGLPIVEAMANKCVVIGRSRGALKELYNGNNAIVVSNLDEVYDEMVKLLENRQKLFEIQESAYATVKKMNWKNSCIEFEKIITSEQCSGE